MDKEERLDVRILPPPPRFTVWTGIKHCHCHRGSLALLVPIYIAHIQEEKAMLGCLGWTSPKSRKEEECNTEVQGIL